MPAGRIRQGVEATCISHGGCAALIHPAKAVVRRLGRGDKPAGRIHQGFQATCLGTNSNRSADLRAALTGESAKAQTNRTACDTNVDNPFVLECLDDARIGKGCGYGADRTHQVVPVVTDAHGKRLRCFADADGASGAALDQDLEHAIADALGKCVA